MGVYVLATQGAYVDKKINPGVTKPPLNFNGGLP